MFCESKPIRKAVTLKNCLARGQKVRIIVFSFCQQTRYTQIVVIKIVLNGSCLSLGVLCTAIRKSQMNKRNILSEQHWKKVY